MRAPCENRTGSFQGEQKVESSFAKGLSVLDLFKEGRISAHLDEIVERLGASKATAYRYLGTLCEAGLLAPTSNGVYVLGPRIIELDRLMRIGDPLLLAGSQVMHELSARRKINMLLASYYRDSIMCVDIAWPNPAIPPTCERGRPMSLFRGAMAKIILAHLSPYQLRTVALNHAQEIREAGLGDDWTAFRTQMAELVREGVSVTHAEMYPGAVGISAPIFDADRKVLGSITFSVAEPPAGSDFKQHCRWIKEAAERVTDMIARGEPAPQAAARPGAEAVAEQERSATEALTRRPAAGPVRALKTRKAA